MAGEVVLRSYDLNGVKESFANWVSNISPQDTPFISMTGKESITNKYFQWQTDSLNPVATNAEAEGSDAADVALKSTTVLKNVTQILRKVVRVSDTSDSLSSWGRGSEMQYQMEKSTKEIKRDLENAFLTQGAAQDAVPPGEATTAANIRHTAGFAGLVAAKDAADPATGAVVHKAASGTTITEAEVFDITEQLYIAGAKATHIMFHPMYAKFFSSLREEGEGAGTRRLMFDGEKAVKINAYVSCIVDPLGQEFCLLPNRFMPKDKIYFFNPSDWTQMVLREPTRMQLAKTGSSEKWMIEMEVGLRHRNPFASGILEVSSTPKAKLTSAGPVQYSADGKTGWATTIPADALKADTDVSYFVRINPTGTAEPDDGSYEYDFKLTATSAGDTNGAAIGGLTLINDATTKNLAKVSGKVIAAAGENSYELTITGDVVDSYGTKKSGTSLKGTWTE